MAELSVELGAADVIGTDADGHDRTIRADRIVVALGSVPDRELAASIEGDAEELFVIGDCRGPRGIARAIGDGFTVGWRI